MPSLPFPRSSTPGHLPTEGQGRLVNCHPEQSGDTWLYRRVPGLSVAATTPSIGPRGMLDLNGTVYAAYNGTLVRVTSDGTATNLGAIDGADKVTWARNNRGDGPDVVVCRNSGGVYLIDPNAGTISAYPDTSLPSNVNSVASLDGYLFFTVPDGRIFASGLNDVWVSDDDHSQNALSFATAEAQPDGLLRGIAWAGIFYAMGTSSIEPWKDQGLQPFPLARVPTVIPVGLLAPMAVAGFEEGWDHSPIFVAHDGTVRTLDGYDTSVISTPDVERFIASSTTSALEALVYTTPGHAWWVLSSDIGTWQYDLTAKSWHERASYGSSRWRGSTSVKSNGRWLIGDTLSTDLLTASQDVRTERGSPLVWSISSAPLKQFPLRAALPSLFADFAVAPLGTNSTAGLMIEWSKDGGGTFAPATYRSLASDELRVNRLGLATRQGLQVRFTVSDPVDFSFSGASVGDPDVRAP